MAMGLMGPAHAPAVRDPKGRADLAAVVASAAVQPAPQAPEPVVGIEQTAPAGMLRPE